MNILAKAAFLLSVAIAAFIPIYCKLKHINTRTKDFVSDKQYLWIRILNRIGIGLFGLFVIFSIMGYYMKK
jgi:hypothetical protein